MSSRRRPTNQGRDGLGDSSSERSQNGQQGQELEEEHGEEEGSEDAEGKTPGEEGQEVARGYGGAVRRFIRTINPVTLALWVLAAGMAALIAAQLVSERM
jgi:hypothetical protein